MDRSGVGVANWTTFRRRAQVGIVKEINSEQRDVSEDHTLAIVILRASNSKTDIVEVVQILYEATEIENILAKCKVDSGTDVNIMPYEMYILYFGKFKPERTGTVLKAFGYFQIVPEVSIKLRYSK